MGIATGIGVLLLALAIVIWMVWGAFEALVRFCRFLRQLWIESL